MKAIVPSSSCEVGHQQIELFPRISTRHFWIALSMLVTIALQPGVVGQTTYQWNGNGANNNWGTGANWTNNSAPTLGSIIRFDGSTRLTPDWNYTDYNNMNQIWFNAGASSFSLNSTLGRSIKMQNSGQTPKIENSSTNLQTLNFANIALDTTTEFNPVNGDLTVNNGSIFIDNNSNIHVFGSSTKTLTFNSKISNGNNPGKVVIRRNSIVVYNGNNSYTAGTFINAGQLRFGDTGFASGTLSLGPAPSDDSLTSDAALYILNTTGGRTLTNAVSVRTGGSGILRLGGLNPGGENIFSGAITLFKAATLVATNGGAVKFSGVISESGGTFGVTIGSSGNTGTVTYDNSMTYNGATTVSFGTLKLDAANRISDSSAVSVASGATFDMNNNSETVGSIAGAGNILMGTAQLIAGQDNSSTSFTGVASGTGPGSFVKKGTGTLSFGGANTYSGNTFIVGGALSFTVAQDGAFTGTLNVGETSGTDPATLAIGTGGVTIGNSITVRSGSSGTMTIAANNTTGTATFSGAVTMNKAVTLSANAGGNLSFVNAIALNANRLTVAGANNTALDGSLSGTGDLLKQGAGTLNLNNSNSFGAASAVFVDNGTIQVNTNSALGATDGSTTGYVNLGASGAGSAGNVTLSVATAMTIANPVDVRYFNAAPSGKAIVGNNSSGTLSFTGPVAVHDTVTISAAAGGTVNFSGAVGTGGGITSSQTNTSDTVLFDAGPGIIKTGGGILEFAGNNTLLNETYVKAGTLQYNGSGTYPSNIRLGDNVASSTVTVNIANPTGGGVVTGIVNTRAGGGGTKTISGSNTSGVNTYGGAIFLDAPVTVSSPNTGATLAFTNTTFDIKGNTLTVTGNGDTEIRGNVSNSSGTGNVVKSGNGALSLKGANTYGGTTTVNDGTLNVGGSLAAGAVSIASGATLAGNGNVGGTVTLNGTISAGSSVGQLNTGPQTWNGGATNITEIIDAGGAAGVGYDHLNVTGGIDLQATSGNQFTINLVSLDGSGSAGNVTNFNNDTSYTWNLASGTIANFDTAAFNLNTSFFSNDLAGGEFILESGSLNLRFTNNHAPVANPASYVRGRGTGIKIPIANLLSSFTSDSDADARQLLSLGASTNGATILNNGTFIMFSSTNDLPESISYTVRDLRAAYRAGDTVRTATALLEVGVSNSIGVVNITNNGGGSMTVSFHGIPGYEYTIQRSSNLVDWVDVVTNTAPINGQVDLTETPPHNPAFYRTRTE